jgi:hypothetical protein
LEGLRQARRQIMPGGGSISGTQARISQEAIRGHARSPKAAGCQERSEPVLRPVLPQEPQLPAANSPARPGWPRRALDGRVPRGLPWLQHGRTRPSGAEHATQFPATRISGKRDGKKGARRVWDLSLQFRTSDAADPAQPTQITCTPEKAGLVEQFTAVERATDAPKLLGREREVCQPKIPSDLSEIIRRLEGPVWTSVGRRTDWARGLTFWKERV